MSVERAIHQRLRTWPALTALVPMERITTGWTPPGSADALPSAAPAVMLERISQGSVLRTSGGRMIEVLLVRFHVQASSFDLAQQIAAALHARCQSSDFVLADTHVQDMNRTNQIQTPSSDGSWQMQIDYQTQVEAFV